jgi:GTP-binding protein
MVVNGGVAKPLDSTMVTRVFPHDRDSITPYMTAKPNTDRVDINALPAQPTTGSRLHTPDLSTTPALAKGWLHTARFLTTAAQLYHLPEHDAPEIAFVGRSNAGKSTAINTLTQQKRLAFASRTPGRTQHINLFSLGRGGVTDAVLADLPGYGYAAVPKQEKYRWQQVMANYLVSRSNLRGVVVMIDPRHGLTELDNILLDVIRPRVEEGLKFLLLLTKADKLNRNEGAKALSIAQLQAGGGHVCLFSSTRRQGVDEVSEMLWNWCHDPALPPITRRPNDPPPLATQAPPTGDQSVNTPLTHPQDAI